LKLLLRRRLDDELSLITTELLQGMPLFYLKPHFCETSQHSVHAPQADGL